MSPRGLSIAALLLTHGALHPPTPAEDRARSAAAIRHDLAAGHPPLALGPVLSHLGAVRPIGVLVAPRPATR